MSSNQPDIQTMMNEFWDLHANLFAEDKEGMVLEDEIDMQSHHQP